MSDPHVERTIAKPSPEQTGLAMYALITISVVLASMYEQAPFEIALLLTGQALSLTVAHAYADSVAHQTTLKAGLKHAAPILVVAAPSVAIAAGFGALGFGSEAVVYVAELVNLAGLVTLQVLATRKDGFTRAKLASAIFLDAVAVTTVVAIVAFLK